MPGPDLSNQFMFLGIMGLLMPLLFIVIAIFIISQVAKSLKARKSYLNGEWKPTINRHTLPITIEYSKARAITIVSMYIFILIIMLLSFGEDLTSALIPIIIMVVGFFFTSVTEWKNSSRRIELQFSSFTYYNGSQSLYNVVYNDIVSIDYERRGRKKHKKRYLILVLQNGTRLSIRLDYFKQVDWRIIIEVIATNNPNAIINPAAACFLGGQPIIS